MKLAPFVLPLLMAGVMSGIYILPEAGEMAPSAIRMKLPAEHDNWVFRQKPPTEDEIQLLADDTEFSKATCFSPRAGEYDMASGLQIPDRIDLSVVLSGHDLNNSIHRPERCMPAQGHVISSSSEVLIDLPNGRHIPVKRLLSVQAIPQNEAHTEYASYQCVTYYFFVGHKTLTRDHLARTLIDIKDRLLYGMDQRWAYVSAAMWYGKVPWIEREVPIEEADAKLRQFLANFAEEQIDWNKIEKEKKTAHAAF